MLSDSNLIQTASSYFLGGLVSLLIITNPLSKIPMFLALSSEMSEAQRRQQARKACVYAFAILTISLFGGVLILRGFGVSYGALRVAGGLTVALLGYRMLFQTAETKPANAHAARNIAFFPIAMPGISGPGAIAVVIGISTEIAELKVGTREAVAYAATVTSIVCACFVVWLTLRFAQHASRWMGDEGMDAMTRMMGFIMVCIGVQLVGSGVRTFMLGT
ncbi:MAG: MarC family NAAT transporter [Burkholderiales bacterium]|nr:MarC family NAAT transporter [Burkholderiales bacterium]